VKAFSTAREAKEFLVNHILSQAQRDGVSLSDAERKMLYFSETAWTLPDMAEVNEEFDNCHDQGGYERKIAGIVRNIQRARTPEKSEECNWERAVNTLRTEDHYLLVLIDSAGSVRPRGDFIKLLLAALAIVCAFLVILVFLRRSPVTPRVTPQFAEAWLA
jgi:hypothetical protein